MGADRRDEGGDSLSVRDGVLFGADREVAEWVKLSIPFMEISPGARALGVFKDGEIVAGVVYERYNGVHLEASIAATPGSGWATRGALQHLFGYPFNQLGCKAISVLVPMSNINSMNLATKLGFTPEAIVKFAAPDGGDLIVLKMFRETCRWIESNG